MTHHAQIPIAPSDSDSESETHWKRLSSCERKKGTSDCRNKRTKSCCNVWAKVIDENILDEALSTAHLDTHDLDAARRIQGWFDSPASHQTNVDQSLTKKRAENVKTRIQERRWNQSVPRKHIGVTFDSPPDIVKEALVRLLKEPNEELIGQIVDVLGCKRALEFYFLTEDIEKIGGLYYSDGTRRRSPGGVFLNLIKMSQDITESEKKIMFAVSKRLKDKLKRKRKKQRLAANKVLKDSERRDIPDTSDLKYPHVHPNTATDTCESTKEEGEVMSTSENECFSQDDVM